MNYVTEKTKKNQETPIVDSLYDLYEDEYLNQQIKYESEVRSYPRRLPLAIKKASGLPSSAKLCYQRVDVSFLTPTL